MNISITTKASLMMLLGNTIFSLTFLATKVALGHVEPLVLITTRFLLCFFVLNLLALLGIGKLRLKGKNIKPLLLLGICQPIVYFLGETYGIKYSSSSFSGIMMALIPATATLLAVPLLKEKIQPKKFLYLLCCFASIAMISTVVTSTGSTTPVGILLLSIAAFSGGLFNVMSRKSSQNFSPFERTYVMFALGATFFLLLTLYITDGRYFSIIASQITNPEVYWPVLFLGIVASVVAFFCVNYGVSYLPLQKATSFANGTTLIAVAAGAIVLHEPITYVHVVATVVIIWSIYQINKK